MPKRTITDRATAKTISAYLKSSLDFDTIKIEYAGTHSSEGLTPIIHYDIHAQHKGVDVKPFRATVHWNNATEPPTITRMDVM